MESLLDQIARHPRALPPLGGALVSVGLFLYLLITPGTLRLRMWFAQIALLCAVWSSAVAVLLSTEELVVAEWAALMCLVAIASLGGPTLAFASSMVRPDGRTPRWPFGISVAAVTLLLARPTLTTVDDRGAHGYWIGVGVGSVLTVLSSLPAATAALIKLWRARGEAARGRRRRQLTWAFIAMGIGILGGVDVAYSLSPRLYPVAWATATVSSLAMYYAIARHRLLAIRTFFRRTVVSLLATGVAVGVVAIVSGLRPEALIEHPAAIVLVVIALFIGTRAWVMRVEPALDALIDRRRGRIGRAWAEFTKRALGVRNPEEVEALLAAALKQALDVELVALVPAERANGTYEDLIEAESVLLDRGGAVLRDLLDEDDAGTRALRQGLALFDGDGLLPMLRDGALLATAVVRGRALSPADDWLEDELGRLGARAAVALGNALMYDEVTRRTASFESEVRVRTGELEEALVELRRAQARLVESERSSSLGLLVAGVSHEINNALNFILANLPTLSMYVGECVKQTETAARSDAELASVRAELPRVIETIQTATRRTRAIVGDLRRFARPDTERRVLLIDEGIEAALNLLRRRIESRIEIVRSYAGSYSVEGFPGPLNQCFFILLFDAIEAATQVVRISIERRGDADREEIEIRISHDGERRAWRNVDEHAARLRLIVARGIVERHGGKLEISAEAEEAARVRLPLDGAR